MITFKHSGNFNKTERFLRQDRASIFMHIAQKYAQRGVTALASATPVDSGETAGSWDYKISSSAGCVKIYWTNSHIVDGVPIAVILQYGHATRNGAFIQGRDYINPAVQPIFDDIVKEAWGEVTK